MQASASARLFRREVHQYKGALHEQVVVRPNPRVAPKTSPMSGVRLVHSGYSLEVVASKEKGRRNVRTAEGELAETSFASRVLSSSDIVILSRAMAHAAQMVDDFAACDEWLDRWAHSASNPAWALACGVGFASSRGDAPLVLAAVSQIATTTVNEYGQRLDRAQLAVPEVWALREAGRAKDADAVAVKAARAGYLPGSPTDLVAVLDVAQRPLAAVVRGRTEEAWRSLAALASEPTTAGLRLLRAMYEEHPGEVTVLACIAAHGGRMSITDAMEWSVPVHRAGLTELCPLRTIAGSPGRDPCDRVVVAAVAVKAYGDLDVLPDLEAALAEVPNEKDQAVAELVEQVAPGLLAPAG